MSFIKNTLLFILTLPQLAFADTGQSASPVVIELFTSQGCSSCPSADKLVSTYADQPGILVLSFHVSYWNYLGWKDPYSQELFTERQRQYSRFLGNRNIYTPQMVVQGRHDIVGTQAEKLKFALYDTRRQAAWVPATIDISGTRLNITLPEADQHDVDVLLIGYRKHVKNVVPRGENAGHNLSHRNSVITLESVARWSGAPLTITHPKPDGDGVAVLLQSSKTGIIIGGAWI